MQPTRSLSQSAEAATLRCPRCGTPFTAQVTTIVDAADPVAREALLGGGLNRASCPSCGVPAQVATPLLYVDLAAEIALVLVPEALALPHTEQERRIGQLTNRVLQALPPEERRMYLVQPRTFVTEQSFFEAVLEANGVSAEDVRRLQESAGLIETLAGAPDEATLVKRLAEAGREPDAELAGLADALAREASERGDIERADRLLALRDRLVAMGVPTEPVLDDLLPRFQEARAAGQLAALAAELRPMLDYGFFAALTARIEGAVDTSEREALTALRSELLAAVDQVDARVHAQIQRGIDSVHAILGAADTEAAVRVRGPALDGAFFAALEQAHRDATQAGRDDVANRLANVRRVAVDLFEAALSPRERLVNHLARARTPDERAKALDAAAEILDADLVEDLRRAAFELRASGASDVAENLRAAADEAGRRIAVGPGARA